MNPKKVKNDVSSATTTTTVSATTAAGGDSVVTDVGTTMTAPPPTVTQENDGGKNQDKDPNEVGSVDDDVATNVEATTATAPPTLAQEGKKQDKELNEVEGEDDDDDLPIRPTFTVALEGNIGCGKSLFAKRFQFYEEMRRDLSGEHHSSKPAAAAAGVHEIHVLQEPLDQWRKYKNRNLLHQFYQHPREAAFDAQLAFLTTKIRQLMDDEDVWDARENSRGIRVLDRSLQAARKVFVPDLISRGLLSPVKASLYKELYKLIETLHPHMFNVHLIVHLKASPEACLKRIRIRDRAEERGMTINYVKAIGQAYDDWLDVTSEKLPGTTTVLTIHVDDDLLDCHANNSVFRVYLPIIQKIANLYYNAPGINSLNEPCPHEFTKAAKELIKVEVAAFKELKKKMGRWISDYRKSDEGAAKQVSFAEEPKKKKQKTSEGEVEKNNDEEEPESAPEENDEEVEMTVHEQQRRLDDERAAAAGKRCREIVDELLGTDDEREAWIKKKSAEVTKKFLKHPESASLIDALGPASFLRSLDDEMSAGSPESVSLIESPNSIGIQLSADRCKEHEIEMEREPEMEPREKTVQGDDDDDDRRIKERIKSLAKTNSIVAAAVSSVSQLSEDE